MSSLDLATAAVMGLSGGAVGGALTTLGLLRYANTKLVGWLLGVRASKTSEPSANVVDAAPVADRPRRDCPGARPQHGEASVRPTRAYPSLHRHHCRGGSSDRLTPADHEALMQEMQVHATAMRSQVSAYADLLAGDDEVLRARLRRFENGGA